ncbi:hypothetical protein M422DRAFT_172849, partial [Sphaerobolus stellatus SS14]
MLGSRVLNRILDEPGITVFCLLRGEPLERLKTSFSKHHLPISKLETTYSQNRLRLLRTKDLCSSNLGLDEKDYSMLRDCIDTIVHAAWPVNFNLPLAEFKPFIACSCNLAQLAMTAVERVQYHFIGSYASTFNYQGNLVPERILEPRVEDSLAQGYAIAKLIAENSLLRIRTAHPSTFDLTIIRVGQICGDTVIGSWNVDEMMPMMIAFLPVIQAFPRNFP